MVRCLTPFGMTCLRWGKRKEMGNILDNRCLMLFFEIFQM